MAANAVSVHRKGSLGANPKAEAGGAGDLVLQEVWRAKDTLSAQYVHDLDKLFAETRKREGLSGHPLVNLPPKGHKG